MLEIIKDKEIWTKTLKVHFSELRDVYFEFDYFNLFAKSFKSTPEALFWEDEAIKLFWTHLVRDLQTIPLFIDYNFFDLITPYGYGGPLLIKKINNDSQIRESIKNFFEHYKKYCLEMNYICEFIRFHPYFKNWEYFEEELNIKYLNNTVILDLTRSFEVICDNMTKNTRYYIRKALKDFNDVHIVNHPTEKEIKEFTDLYNRTMEKNQAAKKYYFTKEFISDHYKFDNLLIYCLNNEEELGSSAIFLKGLFIMHYHLSATNYNFRYPPSRAVLWKAIEWAKENGFKWFHFGGGVSKNDGLFDFKKGFSNTYAQFYIGNIIFNKKIYDELTSHNPHSKENPSYFPLYRVNLEDSIV